MANTTKQLDPPRQQTHEPIALIALAWRFVMAGGYVVAGTWFALGDRWHTDRGASATWFGDLPWGLPDSAARTLAAALLIGWLVYGLAWPVRVVRPWLWVLLGCLQFAALMLFGRYAFAFGLGALHLLAFDPRWLPGRVPAEPEALFYDGACGLCHRSVKRVLRADRDGVLFYFAPLQGRAVERVLTPGQRAALPDSIVVRTCDGRVLVKSDAVLHVLSRLGGWYRLMGLVCGVMPRSVRDLAYDGVAKVRHKVFAKPDDACPILPAELRERFRF
ncbi:MAG: thiol-disulfide oxidoreductase DCC family protein [Phycisphaeraceae bacterium]